MIIGGMLKGHDLFSALSVEDVDRVSRFSAIKNFEAGDTIFKIEAWGSHVYLLLEGQVNLRLPTGPEEVSLMGPKIGKGEIFGLSPLLGAPRYTSSALCESRTAVLAIEAKPFRDLLQNNSIAGFQVMNHVAHVYFTRYLNTIKNLQAVINQIPLIHL